MMGLWPVRRAATPSASSKPPVSATAGSVFPAASSSTQPTGPQNRPVCGQKRTAAQMENLPPMVAPKPVKEVEIIDLT